MRIAHGDRSACPVPVHTAATSLRVVRSYEKKQAGEYYNIERMLPHFTINPMLRSDRTPRFERYQSGLCVSHISTLCECEFVTLDSITYMSRNEAVSRLSGPFK